MMYKDKNQGRTVIDGTIFSNSFDDVFSLIEECFGVKETSSAWLERPEFRQEVADMYEERRH